MCVCVCVCVCVRVCMPLLWKMIIVTNVVNETRHRCSDVCY